MAAQSITTDLTLVNTADPGTLGSWAALGGGQAGLSEETDYFIQGQTSISKQVKAETKGMHADAGAAQTFGTGDHVYIWLYSTTPGASDLRANGGLRLTLGDDANARNEYFVNGSDGYQYGGWICYPVSATSAPDTQVGGGSSPTPRFFGGILSNTVTVKGVNFGVDIIRYGTGVDATGGGTPDPDLTFADIATEDALLANAYGILQPIDAGTALQGRIRIGADDTTTFTSFNDIDAVLTKVNNNPVDVNQKTNVDFSGIIVQGSLTTAIFDGCLFIGRDLTDLGFFDSSSATNKATVTLKDCTFLDWGPTNIFAGNTVTGSNWKTCSSLTLNGASISGCKFINSSPVVAGNDLANISSCEFTRGSAGHAIETSLNTGTINFNGNSFTDYGLDGSATAAINFTANTGSVTVNVFGSTSVPTFLSAGVSVNLVLSNTLTLTGLQAGTEVRVYDAGTATELAGIESTSGTFQTAITVAAIDIVIFNLSYLAIRLTNIDMTSDRTIPIQQQEDRQYENL